MKKFIASLLITTMVLTYFTGMVSADFLDSISFEIGEKDHLLEIYCENGMESKDIIGISDEMIISNIVGFFDFEGQTITFGKSNENKLPYFEFANNVEEYVCNLKKDIKEKELDFYSNNKNMGRDEIDSFTQKNKIPTTLNITEYKIKKVEYIATENKSEIAFDQISNVLELSDIKNEGKCRSNKEITVKVINLNEQKKLIEKWKTEKEVLKNDNTVETTTDSTDIGTNFEVKAQAPLESLEEHLHKKGIMSVSYGAGGPQYLDDVGQINYLDLDPPPQPKKGDRQDRLKQDERFNDSSDNTVYDWTPIFGS